MRQIKGKNVGNGPDVPWMGDQSLRPKAFRSMGNRFFLGLPPEYGAPPSVWRLSLVDLRSCMLGRSVLTPLVLCLLKAPVPAVAGRSGLAAACVSGNGQESLITRSGRRRCSFPPVGDCGLGIFGDVGVALLVGALDDAVAGSSFLAASSLAIVWRIMASLSALEPKPMFLSNGVSLS